jgi:hypothetical protein
MMMVALLGENRIIILSMMMVALLGENRIASIIASIGLAAANVIIVYVTVAKSTSGAIRKQAIYTMIGVILPIVFQVFGSALKIGTFPNASDIQGIIFNSAVIVGLLLFYKSKI